MAKSQPSSPIGQLKKGTEELVTVAQPLSPVSEAFRALRTNIRFSSVDEPLRTLLVTSPGPTEGKSLTVANLAVVMAQAGLKVVVVDGDLRRPRLHRLFKLHPRDGLTGSLLEGSMDGRLQPADVEGLAVLPWSPLAGGWLTGKYRRNQPPPPNSRVGRKDRWDDQPEQRASELTWRVIDTLVALGEEYGKTPAQVALKWLLQQPGVTSPIIGARTLEQLEDNLGSTGWSLSAEDIEKLNTASAVPLPYPYSFIKRYTRKRT